MSKRESNATNTPEAKKPKLTEELIRNLRQLGIITPQQRPNSPVAGPSSAPSDPDLQVGLHTDFIPICHLDDILMQDNISQSSSVHAPSSTMSTSSSTNAECGDPRTSSVEDMDVDSDLTATESSTSTDRCDEDDNKEKTQSDQ